MTMWRKIEVYRNGEWLEIGRGDVKAGDRFRLFEPDGTLVVDGNNKYEWIATSDSMPTEPDGNFMVRREGGIMPTNFELEWDKVSDNVYRIAKDKGWWDNERNDAEIIALCHSELSETLEALRRDNPLSDKLNEINNMYTSAEEELADVVIRIMDMASAKGWDIPGAILAKIKYNEKRTYMHGGKKF